MGRIDRSIAGYFEQIAQIVLFGFLTVLVVMTLTYQALSITYPYPLDYGEAPLVDQTLRLASGGNIYRADISLPPYTISNYPPGYLIVLAPFVRWFGPNFWFGRLVSALCAIVSGLLLAYILHRFTQDRLAAAITGLVFFTFPYVTKWSAYLRIDLLALALSLGGISLLVRRPLRRKEFVSGALLLVAAIFTRQSYALAAPLAAFTWFLFKDWRKAFLLAAVVGGVSLLLFLLLNALTGGGFFFNIVTANVNEFDIERLEWNLRDLWRVAAIFLVVAGMSFFLSPRKMAGWPLVSAYVVGACLSALTIGKIGSNVNYFLELCAALSLAAGSAVAWCRKYQGSHLLRTVVLGLFIVQAGMFLTKTLHQYIPELAERRAEQALIRNLSYIVQSTTGPVLADEYMGLVTLAGKPLEIQPFEVTQLANAGIWDQKPLIEGIEAQRYPLILIHDRWGEGLVRERWTAEMLEAIERHYRMEQRVAGTRVYRPKDRP